MKIKQIIMTSLLSFITAMTFIACSDDDSNNDIKIPPCHLRSNGAQP